MKSIRQFELGELEFRAAPGAANPWAEVELRAVFSGPDGQTLALDGFYDGADRWGIRFCPPARGRWSYRTACRALPALDGREGTVDVAAPSERTPLARHGGLLKVDGAHQGLTYTDGTPFFWLGDTWWFCPSDHIPLERSNRPDIPSMYRHLLEIRRRQGFTVLHMAFLRTIRGTEALSFARTLRDPVFDVRYWQTADRYMALANEAGLIPAIAVGWSVNYTAYSLDELRHVWRYVVARYGSFAVTWLICGEYNVIKEGEPPEPMNKAMALGRYIKEIDPYRRAMTVHPWFYAGDQHQAWSEDWCDFIMIQGGHWGDGKTPPASVYRDAYRTGKPVLEGETNYEAIHAGHPVSPAGVRLCAYHAIQNGSFGFTYGSHGLWYPNEDEADTTFSEWGKPRPWWVALDDPGAGQMGILRRLYESVKGWELEPWPEALIVETAGEGRNLPCAKGGGNPLRCVIYFPPDFPVDEAVRLRLAGTGSKSRDWVWFNPRTGEKGLPQTEEAAQATEWCLPTRPTPEDWVLMVTNP